MSKRTFKNRFFSKRLKIKQKTCENWSGFLYELCFQVGVNVFESEKTSVQASVVPKLKEVPKDSNLLSNCTSQSTNNA